MVRITVYEDVAGEWRWRAQAPNFRTVADSAEGYTTRYGAKRAAQTFADSMYVLPAEVVG